MKSVVRIAVSLALVAAPAVALASAGSGRIYVTNCDRELYKPTTIGLACADGVQYMTKLKWSHWGRSGASASGTDEVNNCKPDCAAGHASGYAATVALSKPISCHKQKHKVFNRLTLTFTGKVPKGYARTGRFSLGCPML